MSQSTPSSDAAQTMPISPPVPSQAFYPPGYLPMMPTTNALGYPTGPVMPPPGYAMPPGYALMPAQYPMPPVAAPVVPQAEVPYAKPDTPPPAPASPAFTPVSRPNVIARWWRQLGGGSLTFSILIHAGLILAAGLIVFTTTMPQKQVDFLPGGGTQQGAEASAALTRQIAQKRRQKLPKSMPKQRIVVSTPKAVLSLPDAPPDLLSIPDASSGFSGGGVNGGFGSAGFGNGFGKGTGKGGLGGVTFKPLMMFGMELKDTRKIAVVMDVSRSMTRYLPIVAKELDKVAQGSPLVLYFGCGLKTPPRGLEDKVRKVNDARFDKFWYWWEGKEDMGMVRKDYEKLKIPSGEPMPLDAVYQQMKNRPNTYFIDFNGIAYTSPALVCKEVTEADTIYWFADFQDAVDLEHVKDIMRKLRGRKQKLYMHASVRGESFEIVRDELCLPLGGEVLETKVE